MDMLFLILQQSYIHAYVDESQLCMCNALINMMALPQKLYNKHRRHASIILWTKVTVKKSLTAELQRY